MLPSKGYTAIFDKMLDNPNIKLMLNTDFTEIFEIKNDDFYFMGQPFSGELIYTGKIDQLFNYKFGELAYKSVNMQFETIEKELYQDAATVNYPNNYKFTRITEFKHMHPSDSKKTTILKEFPQEHIPGKNTPYYPVFTEATRASYEQYAEYAKSFKNLTLVGRLAEYKYYDMDDMVSRALSVFNEKFQGR